MSDLTGGKVYKDTVGLILTLDTGVDITDSDVSLLMKVRKPDGEEVEWTATVLSTSKLKYITQNGDLGQSGSYLIQAVVMIGSQIYYGETTSFQVSKEYE